MKIYIIICLIYYWFPKPRYSFSTRWFLISILLKHWTIVTHQSSIYRTRTNRTRTRRRSKRVWDYRQDLFQHGVATSREATTRFRYPISHPVWYRDTGVHSADSAGSVGERNRCPCDCRCLLIKKYGRQVNWNEMAILCSVLNWRKLWGSNLSTHKMNPLLPVSGNVHSATGCTFYTRVRCVLCTLARKNAHGWINCFAGGQICNVKGTANLVLNKV